MKTIIVACGGGIATSATVATKINNALEEQGLSSLAKAEAVDIKSLDMFIKNADVYVSITPVVGVVEEYEIPVVSGIPLLTGVGRDETIEKIIELIK
ncbi:PTS sugar transporter subunit IIB [Breznakia pachnodae]|uniref:PTS system galactitol-specific IIB component n=1 Tax=Breznakia pachnodae TaxID=265178 RepID=A0ABU0E6E4_9FIRM|nr:PTS sugar transporter subunit IIB [Breznakia pachnodae]MDQ0362273.1 PTS system galactitol-specific IIB component [Breznakia pachnodae]